MPHLASLESLLAVLGSIGAFVVFLGTAWWKLSGAIREAQLTITALVAESAKHRTQIVHTAKQVRDSIDSLGRRLSDLERSLAVQATILGEREKDVTRLEGKLETAHDDTLKVVATLGQTSSSLDALWRSLSRLHPQEVPRRASDRG